MGLPSGLFPLGFPTKPLYAPLLSRIRDKFPANLIHLDLIYFFIFLCIRITKYAHILTISLQFRNGYRLFYRKKEAIRNIPRRESLQRKWYWFISLLTLYDSDFHQMVTFTQRKLHAQEIHPIIKLYY
jgi:hypothetical protein